MRRIFWGTLALFFLLMGIDAYAETRQEKIDKIDSRIEELQNMKRGYEARALRQEDLAQYLQFETQAWLEMRRHLKLAEENRQKAAQIQLKIDELEAEKRKLQK